MDVNRRSGQAVAGRGSNVLRAINKRQSRRGHRRRRSGSHPNIDSLIRHKELSALVQGAQFDADSQTCSRNQATTERSATDTRCSNHAEGHAGPKPCRSPAGRGGQVRHATR
jgi:hypothetical protein